MTATTAPPASSAPARSASAQRLRSYFIFTFCVALYFVPFMRFLRLGTDEGTLVEGAVRIMQGQVFARDFFEVMGPGTFYWLATFFKAFGVTFLATRICMFLTSLGTALVIYFLTRQICKQYQILPCIVMFATYFGGQWPAISHHVDSNLFALLSVACIAVWQDRRCGSQLFAGGFFAGVTTCIHLPKGIFLVLSLLLWLWLQRRRHPYSKSAFGLAMTGYFSVLAIVSAYFWTRGALWDLINANIVWPRSHYAGVDVRYAQGLMSFYWDPWVSAWNGAWWAPVLASFLSIPLFFIAALPGLLLILAVPYKRRILKPKILLFWLSGWSLWISELHRKDISHLVFGSPLLVILCVYFLLERPKRIADLSLQTLAIGAGALACFNLFLITALSVHSSITRVGTISMFRSDPVLSFLNEHTVPGEEIFAYPYCPMYYFLSSTTNPTRYSILLYDYNTPFQFKEVVRLLDQRRVKYVVWNTRFQVKAGDIFYFDSRRMSTDQFIVEPYLDSHYKVVEDDDGIVIMKRREDDHAH